MQINITSPKDKVSSSYRKSVMGLTWSSSLPRYLCSKSGGFKWNE